MNGGDFNKAERTSHNPDFVTVMKSDFLFSRDQKLIADPRKAVRDPIYHGRGSLGSNLARWPGITAPKTKVPGAPWPA
ncbi:hypothetical protein EVAR_61919_1 [Eumeta japonica]|uniref:Uncharacterized protein n=1 Tax=Eumeta variegata TaxID=151549 RepID=A0A4C1ZKV0_EUMVA|nr:hypothetical protein EVAR_61919_1 [Eumeta japonica]